MTCRSLSATLSHVAGAAALYKAIVCVATERGREKRPKDESTWTGSHSGSAARALATVGAGQEVKQQRGLRWFVGTDLDPPVAAVGVNAENASGPGGKAVFDDHGCL